MSSNWWASKLGGQQPAPRPSVPAPVYPQTQTPRYAPPAPYFPPAPVAPPQSISEALARGVHTEGGDAARAGENSRCPNCGSGHFFTMGGVTDDKGHRGPAPRCFSCGYTAHLPMQGVPRQ